MNEENKLPNNENDMTYDGLMQNEEKVDLEDYKSLEDMQNTPSTHEDTKVDDDISDDDIKGEEVSSVSEDKKSEDSDEDVADEVNDIDKSYDDDNVDNHYKEEVEEKDKKKSKVKREKKPMTKSTKIVLIVVAVVLAIAIIATSITVPIVLHNKGKIFVSSSEDFQNHDGDLYVLKSDVHVAELTIGEIARIDFNGKTLTVDNVFTIKDGKDKTEENRIVIGTNLDKKKVHGTLQVGKLLVDTQNDIDFNIMVTAKNMDIKASNVSFNEGVDGLDTAKISADNLYIRDNFSFNDVKSDNVLTMVDVNEFVLDGSFTGNIDIKNNKASDKDNYLTVATLNNSLNGSIYANKKDKIVVNNEVSGVIKAADTSYANKIGKVIINKSAFVKIVDGAEIVYIHKDAPKPDIKHGKFEFIRQLERVGYIAVDDSADVIYLEFPIVPGADTYCIKIDGVSLSDVKSSELLPEDNKVRVDITSKVRDVNKHTIEVYAKSESNGELLLDSPILGYEYMTYTTLSKATGIVVRKVDVQNPEDPSIVTTKTILQFNKVDFADNYVININGVELSPTSETTIDVTDIIKNGGTYVISIVATSNNENILPSKPSMGSYINKVTLDKPYFEEFVKDNDKVTLTFNPIDNADYYLILYNDNVILNTIGNKKVIAKTDAKGNEVNKTFVTVDVDINEYGISEHGTFQVVAISSNSSYYENNMSDVKTY